MMMEIGTDIVSIRRISSAHKRHGERFLSRFLHKDEIALCRKPSTIAGFWAAKEAIAKAFGCGIGKTLSFHDIHLAKSKSGQPTAKLSKLASQKLPHRKISISISHDGDFAVAVAVVI